MHQRNAVTRSATFRASPLRTSGSTSCFSRGAAKRRGKRKKGLTDQGSFLCSSTAVLADRTFPRGFFQRTLATHERTQKGCPIFAHFEPFCGHSFRVLDLVAAPALHASLRLNSGRPERRVLTAFAFAGHTRSATARWGHRAPPPSGACPLNVLFPQGRPSSAAPRR